jgi:hypothetical protein
VVSHRFQGQACRRTRHKRTDVGNPFQQSSLAIHFSTDMLREARVLASTGEHCLGGDFLSNYGSGGEPGTTLCGGLVEQAPVALDFSF